MNKNRTLVYLFILSCFFNVSQLLAQGDACIAYYHGSWHDDITWSCGHVPVVGDIITIETDVEVTISSLVYLDGAFPTNTFIFGKLRFNPPPCSGNGCNIFLWLAASSQIYVHEENSIFLGPNADADYTFIYIGGDIVLNGDGNFPYGEGPSWLPDLSPLPVELTSFYGTLLSAPMYSNGKHNLRKILWLFSLKDHWMDVVIFRRLAELRHLEILLL